MRTKIDLSDKIFGKLKPIKNGPQKICNGSNHSTWECECACGNKVIIRTSSLTSGSTKSCGCATKNKKNLTGSRFGRLVVLKESDPYISSTSVKRRWECICDCGKIKVLPQIYLTTGDTKSCGCLRKETTREKSKKNKNARKLRKGTLNIKPQYFHSLKKHAFNRKLEFDITIEYIQSLLEQQNFKCAITGELLIMDRENVVKNSKNSKLNTASLDRINSGLGYLIGNVQWVHKEVNTMKWNFTMEKLVSWCKKIINFQNEKNNNIDSK